MQDINDPRLIATTLPDGISVDAVAKRKAAMTANGMAADNAETQAIQAELQSAAYHREAGTGPEANVAEAAQPTPAAEAAAPQREEEATADVDADAAPLEEATAADVAEEK